MRIELIHISYRWSTCDKIDIDSREEFQCDGLALIQRNSTNYVNEPAVTGGNPILAGDKILFNDMLGTTLGVKDGENLTQNNLTAFGETLNSSLLSENSFFTGKPHVGEMGYVFLFRAYRADQGKWNSQDTVALTMTLPSSENSGNTSSSSKKLGYPDGWNNLAYVNNNVTMYIDWQGCEWIPVFDSGVILDYHTTNPIPATDNDNRDLNGIVRITQHIDITYVDAYSESSGWDGTSEPTAGTVWTLTIYYTQHYVVKNHYDVKYNESSQSWAFDTKVVTIRDTITFGAKTRTISLVWE